MADLRVKAKKSLVGSDEAKGLRNGIQNADAIFRFLNTNMTTHTILIGTRRYTTMTQTGTCVGGTGTYKRWQDCR
jgi:hypothetical protein